MTSDALGASGAVRRLARLRRRSGADGRTPCVSERRLAGREHGRWWLRHHRVLEEVLPLHTAAYG